jgi:Tol biopolymer transport system component
MGNVRNVEIYSADCPVCQDAVALVRSIACSSCQISVLDLNDPDVASRAASLGIRSVPSVAVDGELVACCTDRGLDEGKLRASGIGNPT